MTTVAAFNPVSLVISAILTVVLGGPVPIPPPLSAMRPALAGVYSYRMTERLTTLVQVSGLTDGERPPPASRSDVNLAMVVVRRAVGAEIATVVTSTAQGRAQVTEDVNTPTRYCTRQGRAGAWRCTPLPHTTAPLLLGLRGLLGLLPLRHIPWTTVAAAVIQGQRCQGYQTVWQTVTPASRGRATLWLSRVSRRPVALVSVEVTSLQPAGASSRTQGRPPLTFTTTVTQTIVWDAWNSPALTAPRL